MKPNESLDIRLAMAEMHESVLNRIKVAYENEQHIEVCWLCYACFESRVNRVLQKICVGCNKEKRQNNQYIGIVTKLECYKRLIKNNYEPLIKEDENIIKEVILWCKERNKLIHGLVSLEHYNDADNKFKTLSQQGKTLVEKMYIIGKDVREYYYQVEQIPKFNDDVVKKCKLKYKCI